MKKTNDIKNTIRNVKRKYMYIKYKNLSSNSYPDELSKWYKKRTGKALDLNNPKTINEKMQWLKLFNSTPLKTILADKYLARNWIKNRIGEKYLVPLIGVWDNFDDIDFYKLPNKFVLKANHGCKMNIIVKDKRELDIASVRKKVNSWLKINYAFHNGFELVYKDIVPKIIIEEYLENKSDDLLEYKVWCFNGKAHYIMFLSDRDNDLKMNFYDTDWNLQPFRYSYPPTSTKIYRPDNLTEIIEIAEKCAEDFSHVRVDFYRLDDGTLKFAEMTFSSFSGICRWDPKEYDEILGELLVLPKEVIKNENF